MENEIKMRVSDTGAKIWTLNGNYHREDGPAIEHHDGTKYWFFHGERHRLDGPAVMRSTGKTKWYINDYNVTEKITQWAEENDIDLDNLSEVDKALIKLIW